jgi:hypothetical protein
MTNYAGQKQNPNPRGKGPAADVAYAQQQEIDRKERKKNRKKQAAKDARTDR